MKQSVEQLDRCISTLQQLSACSSLSDKKEIIRKELSYNPTFGEVLNYALDPYKKFGFAKGVLLAMTEPTSGLGKWPMWKTLLDKLRSRQLTGSAAKAEVTKFSSLLSVGERKLLRMILLKDLRCGVGATLVNSISPGLVPEFGVMLASPLEPQHLKKLQAQKQVFVQAKKNGDRCVVICSDQPAAYSRNGHEVHNYAHIVNALADLCNRVGKSYVFDGEVINGDFYGTRGVKKKAGNNADSAVFYCFDIVSLEDWELGKTAPYSERRATLRKVFHHVRENDPLERVLSHGRAGSDMTWKALEELRDVYMQEGEEGLIIRLDEPYNFKTRSSLYKFKKMIENDFVIVEILEGEAGKKYEGMAAKVLVEDSETVLLGDGETCEAGLEGDMAFRKNLYKNRAKYVGMTCEVHYQELTRNKEGKPKLQFGVMKKIRGDKS